MLPGKYKKKGLCLYMRLLSTVLVLGLCVYFLVIIYLLKKRVLSLKYTLLWLFTGIVLLVVAIWPEIFDVIIRLMGIELPVNAVFLLTIGFLYMIVMSITAIVSKQTEQIKVLIQSVALLEKQVREMEKGETDRENRVKQGENE